MTDKQEYRLLLDLELQKIEIGFYKEFVARCGLQEQYMEFLLNKNKILDDRDF